jgi:hypothetical protein
VETRAQSSEPAPTPDSAGNSAPGPANGKPAPGYGLPNASTGNWLLDRISNLLIAFVHIERRFDPFFRPLFDALFRNLLIWACNALINFGRTDDGLKLAEEKIEIDEEAHLDDMIATMHRQMEGLWKPGGFQRGGNTKTHGIVRAELTVRDDLPEHLRRGIYATPRTYPAWVRFSGPGPYITADIDDVGFMSMSIKLMDVPGEKLMDDEKHTQDLLGVCTATFVTADTKSNTDLQHWSLKNASVFHFVKFKGHHLLDFAMQGLWTKTQSSPLECQYFSCVPYLLGEGQAMMYSMRPRSTARTRVPRLPLRPPHNYLRQAMAATLARQDVEFDILLQVQTDPHKMPIENAAVFWPPRLSPRIPAATLRIPKQTFDSRAQLEFARVLSYNPWHSIAEHRPLGNQSRARLRMYKELSTYRQKMNSVQHHEPDGSETFPEG